MCEERETVCRICMEKHGGTIPKKPGCRQKICPINDDEFRAIGAKHTDVVTKSGLVRMMEISIRPDCLENMLNGMTKEQWVEKYCKGIFERE